tara:strand:+ start:2779 stop:3903 length:1125 start_codon:yes stop_codon:yes gene_type:complete
MNSEERSIYAEFVLNYPSLGSKPFCLNVALRMPSRGVTAIFGPSGSGKTSLLRCMAGLEKVASAKLSIGNEVWQDQECFVPVHKRQQGMVFQEASLFSHLTVKGNLDYAIKRVPKKLMQGELSSKKTLLDCQKIVQLLGISHLLNQYPSSLSGGERQRVAIARALLRQPKILFMDEPLAALDFKRKQEIMPYLERLSQVCNIPIIYITHSLEEVARLADYLVVMDEGKVVTKGELEDVLSRVDIPIILDNDLGAVLKAKVVEKDNKWHLMRAQFDGGELWLKDNHLAIGDQLRVRVLAKDVSLSLAPQDSSILNSLPAEVIEVVDDIDKAMSLVRLKVGNTILISRLTRRSVGHLMLSTGLAVWAQIKSVAILP